MKAVWNMAAGGLAIGLAAAPAFAAETIRYTYDARGRLVSVVRSGGPAPATTTAYQFDKADNRTRKTVTTP